MTPRQLRTARDDFEQVVPEAACTTYWVEVDEYIGDNRDAINEKWTIYKAGWLQGFHHAQS